MVSGSAAFFHEHGLGDAVSLHNKCRYKTGKCTNTRSSKRNGQPHMLCLYHRDKANKIQRKFDRQKRQSVRTKKASGASDGALRHGNAATAFANSMAPAPAFTDAHSDSDSGRLSTDSESSRLSTDSDACSTASLEQAWQNLPSSAMLSAFAETVVAPTAIAMGGPSCGTSMGGRFHGGAMNAGSLSHEELDFLYSAMLE